MAFRVFDKFPNSNAAKAFFEGMRKKYEEKYTITLDDDGDDAPEVQEDEVVKSVTVDDDDNIPLAGIVDSTLTGAANGDKKEEAINVDADGDVVLVDNVMTDVHDGYFVRDDALYAAYEASAVSAGVADRIEQADVSSCSDDEWGGPVDSGTLGTLPSTQGLIRGLDLVVRAVVEGRNAAYDIVDDSQVTTM